MNRFPSPNPLHHIHAATAREVCALYPVPDAIKRFLHPRETPIQFLDRLLADQEVFFHAVDFLAHALPKRQAVWWGCLCVEVLDGKQLSPEESVALRAAVRWVVKDTEDLRRAAQKASEAADGTPAGTLAKAAFESGGSLLPPGLPVVEPPATLTARGVAGAIHLLAAKKDAEEMLPAYRRCLAVGIGVAHMKQQV